MRMNADLLTSMKKQEIPAVAKNLKPADINFLVKTLQEKNDTVRYNAFLLLKAASRNSQIVYDHWDELEKKIENANSYQRNIGLRLVSENVRWDKKCKFEKILKKYLLHCTDEKFITSRQAIQGLITITRSTDRYDKRIMNAIDRLSFNEYNAGQQKLLQRDVTDARAAIGKSKTNRK